MRTPAQLQQGLHEDAARADDLHRQSRELLVAAARRGLDAGLTQREIAVALGRSQPEVSRLLRFRGVTLLGSRLSARRARVIALLARHGARRPRVFGSVARGEDRADSDVDLLVEFTNLPSLFELARLESELAELLDAPVDIVAAGDLRDHLAPSVLRDAVPL